MTEKRLMDITLLSIENSLRDSICLDDVVTEFERKTKTEQSCCLRSNTFV